MTEDQDDMYCVECKKKENDSNKLVICQYCFSCAHYKCRNIIGVAVRRIKENPYFCSLKCSEIYTKIIEMQNARSSMINELNLELKKTVTNIVSAQLQGVKSEVNTIVRAIEESQEFLSSKFDGVVTDVQNLKDDNIRLKSEVDGLKKSQSEMASLVHKLESNCDKTNKESLSNNAVILGIPVHANECVPDLVTKVAECIGADFPPHSILSAARVSSSKDAINKLVPIRIIFKENSVKESFFSKKREFGKLLSSSIDQSMLINGRPTNIAVRDELTPLSLGILNELRNSQKKLNLKFVWAGRDGIILVKKDEHSKPIIIRDRNDLGNFMNESLSCSSSHTTPSPKRKKAGNLLNLSE